MISVDGQEAGSITGGGSKSIEVDKTVPHTFLVDSEVKSSCSSYEGTDVCTRYRCTDHRWTVGVAKTQTCQTISVCVRVGIRLVCTYEQQCQTTTDLKEKAHTFEYFTEHELVISDIHGQSVDKWYRQDSDISASAEEFAVIRDDNNVRERDVFQDWMVNGVRTESRTLGLKMDKPYFIRAEYRTETQYRVRLISDFGNPSLDNPSGWYLKGQEASVTVEKELPAQSWIGTLGGKTAFVAWHSLTGTQSEAPSFTFIVEDPVVLRVEWKTDYSMPIAIITIVAVLIVGVFGLALHRTGQLSKLGGRSEEQSVKRDQLQTMSVQNQLSWVGLPKLAT
jgi:hypothetical protein